MEPVKKVVVYGAYGHTGRFVVKELLRRSLPVVVAGRNGSKIDSLAKVVGIEGVQLDIEEAEGFDRILADKSALINCAGPFLDTAPALVKHAIRSGVPYFDVAAEQRVVYELFSEYARAEIDSLVVPGVAFYGQLGELLIAETLGDMTDADVTLAIGLDSWEPTVGTRKTGSKNPGLRRRLIDGQLEEREPFPGRLWTFAGRLGEQAMLSLALSEAVLVEQSKRVKNLRTYINEGPIKDLVDESTPAPTPSDEFGASSQFWEMDVEITDGGLTRRASLTGRDIYAVSGQLVVHAVETLLSNGVHLTGIRPLSQVVAPQTFLDSFIGSSAYIERGATDPRAQPPPRVGGN